MEMPTLASRDMTKKILEHFGLSAKHKLGQNFLIDQKVVDRIIELAQLHEDDVVMEVGPGIGTLTTALLPRVRAVLIAEMDRALIPVVYETASIFAGPWALNHLAVYEGDALHLSADQAQELLKIKGFEAPNKLVSNLPYQIAATLILNVAAEFLDIAEMVVMVQAEVADRIAGRVGTKAYGAYTAKLAQFMEVTGRFEVGHQCFFPEPHVESAVIRLTRREGQWTQPMSSEKICAFIDAAFLHRRKTLQNSFKQAGFDLAILQEAADMTGIDLRARAETITPDDYRAFAAAYYAAK